MRYHDFHLSSYSVSDFGATITLCLIYDYPSEKRVESHIEFSTVEAYHFVHTGGAILTDIMEVSLGDLLDQVYEKLFGWYRWNGGYRHWKGSRAEYCAVLESKGFRGWLLDSAIGFEGFVIAKNVEQKVLYKSPPAS